LYGLGIRSDWIGGLRIVPLAVVVTGPFILLFGDTIQTGTAFTSEIVLALSAEQVFADFTIESVLTFIQVEPVFTD
jgi:hypothetical protein